jgi:hypothetical protein
MPLLFCNMLQVEKKDVLSEEYYCVGLHAVDNKFECSFFCTG